MTARCAICNNDKPLVEFSPLRRGSYRKDGVSYCFSCNDCAREVAETVINNHIEMKLHEPSGFLISRNGFAFMHDGAGALLLVGKLASSGYVFLPCTHMRTNNFIYLHRIVYEVFGGAQIPSHNEQGQRLVIAHHDDQKLNNAFENLELITQGQNIRNAVLTGVKPRASTRARSVIATNCTSGETTCFPSANQAAVSLNIDRSAIRLVCTQKQHTTKNRTTGQAFTFVFA